jgi:large subunit ribosomal protein L5e
MKGACDGGINIPHNERRFPGTRMEKAEVETGKKRGGGAVEEKAKPKLVFKAEEHLEHIMGVHVQEYYDLLKAENPSSFKRQFSVWEKNLKGKKFADLYKACHEAIRKNPERTKTVRKQAPVRKVVQPKPTLIQQNSKGQKWLRPQKIGCALRHERVQARIAKISADL